jgi:hypothetical protein
MNGEGMSDDVSTAFAVDSETLPVFSDKSKSVFIGRPCIPRHHSVINVDCPLGHYISDMPDVEALIVIVVLSAGT